MKPHEEWLVKAENDLESSKYLLLSGRPFDDIIVYHSQQCAEKSLKAYLAYLDREIEKTHDLRLLTDICASFDSAFMELKEYAVILSPYAQVYRYPIEKMLPSREETELAISYADKIFQFVKEKINV